MRFFKLLAISHQLARGSSLRFSFGQNIAYDLPRPSLLLGILDRQAGLLTTGKQLSSISLIIVIKVIVIVVVIIMVCAAASHGTEGGNTLPLGL
jgi:hypothetical protein